VIPKPLVAADCRKFIFLPSWFLSSEFNFKL
jgi:hypothetical protein